jgi:CHAT domain-containing protein/tetratricopeptide (TPR) repeat protein
LIQGTPRIKVLSILDCNSFSEYLSKAISLALAAAALLPLPSLGQALFLTAETTKKHITSHADINAMTEKAKVLVSKGKYAQAIAIWQQILAIVERAFGSSHPNVAGALDNIAFILMSEGQYAAAEPLVRRSLAIREKALGTDHPEVATSLNNLANLLRDQGQFAAAEHFYRLSLSIYEKSLEPNHTYIATCLNNLAFLLRQKGQYGAAELLYRRSLTILVKALGFDHPDTAYALTQLAELLTDQGQFAAAEPLVRRSLAILAKAHSLDHRYIAASLNSLAFILMYQGHYAAAEPLFRRSLSISEKALGSDHPDIAAILNNLALLFREKGEYGAAESLYKRSITISENALGPDHLHLATSIANLAMIQSIQGQFSSAIASLRRFMTIKSTWLVREIGLLPDRSRSAQLQQIGNTWQIPYTWVSHHPGGTQLALEFRLNRQGLLSEIEQRQALLLNTPGFDRTKVEKLQALIQQLSSITLPSDRRSELREQRNKLQSEIYRQIPQLELKLVTTPEVAKALPVDGVLVEFQRYQPYVFRKPKGQRWGEPQYIALVLKPDASVASVPLGPAAAIDSTIHKGLRASAERLSDADTIWAELSEQLLKPLLPHLTGSRQWFLSPDGELNRVPFAALPAPQKPGTRLAQIVQLRLITTGRELVKLQQPTPTGNASLVMANPTYDRPGAKSGQASRAAEVTTVVQQRSAELGSNQWKQLPASEREGQKVAKLLSTGLISGTSATTKALQRHQGPRVLHVATHGFFVADQETKPTEPLRTIQESSPLLSSLRQEDPQLRSGLVLAGANQPDVDPNDDGYLTAAEAVNLNLKGTELVVLSACSTGQGEVRTGEGVYGLQRSLTVAGARSTLLSLWKVDDAATAEFMVRYYQRLKAGEGRSDALVAVQEEFRSGKVQSGTGVDWKDPYYWAAWQLVGDWRPIPGL